MSAQLAVESSVLDSTGRLSRDPTIPDRPRERCLHAAISNQLGYFRPASVRRRMRLTRHAIERWCQRVERCDQVDDVELGRSRLAEFVAHARRRSRPRHWTDVEAIPGVSFLYWVEHPDICALVVNNAVVTVIARARTVGSLRVRRAHPDCRESAPSWALHDAAFPAVAESDAACYGS